MKKIRQWLRVRLAYWLHRLPFLPTPSKKFVIFGQGRTGSTLLVDLLNSAEDIYCDKEIFNIFHFTGERIRKPNSYINGRSKRFFNKVYGFKVKIYQLKYDHKVASVRGFLDKLLSDGYQIVYLSRDNVLQHAYSNIKRSVTGVTHVRDQVHKKNRIALPAKEFLDEVSLRLQFKKEEMDVLQGLKYFHVNYEKDLAESDHHLRTVNAVRAYLNLVPLGKVNSKYQKITSKSLADEITNYEEIVAALKEKQLDYLIW